MKLHLDQLQVYQIFLRVIQVPLHIHHGSIVFKVPVYLKILKTVHLLYKNMWRFKMQTHFFAPFIATLCKVSHSCNFQIPLIYNIY